MGVVMSISFDIGRFLVRPGRKLYGFLVRSRVKPGAVAEIASIPARYNITILHLAFSRTQSSEKPITALAFLDFTDSDISPEKLAEEVGKLEFVEEVKIIKPKVEGFIADTASFPLMVSASRAIIFSEEGLKGLIVDLRERIGSGAEAILYFSGFEVGRELAKKYFGVSELLGIKGLREKIIFAADVFMSVGYGILEILKFEENPPYALLRIHRCMECELGRNAGKPFSHFIRGILAGFNSQILGVKMFARETKCIAKGDPYCEFEVTPDRQKLI
ncbi:MAG: hypothetical protein DRO43_04745 [Candidatus Hecatellales archaeon]|nr:MAG: hypothetical protein DRO43_04745 [Candidatus Hecatellales archaeon]